MDRIPGDERENTVYERSAPPALLVQPVKKIPFTSSLLTVALTLVSFIETNKKKNIEEDDN